MSFYGVAHDRLPRVVTDRETAVRATVSTSFVLGEADRRIGDRGLVRPAGNHSGLP